MKLTVTSAARSDAIWSQTSSHGVREPGAIGQVDRAGRVLRTPKVRVSQGVLWHRVRGNLQIVTVVDGHRLIHGPLYGPSVMQVDTQGEWQWVRQDLRRDLRWLDTSHVVHVEYAAIAGAAEVAEVVAAAEEPVRPDPFLASFRERPDPPLESLRGLLASVTNACRDGRSLSPAQAILANRLLASPRIEWAEGPAKQLADEAARAASAEHAALARTTLASATAPAILDGNGIDQFVLVKGAAARPGEQSPRRFLEAIDGPEQSAWPTDSSGRRELADRVLAADNPLTARVAVNRVWHHLFGRGLVATPDNFGLLGEPPADPLAQALLDTLAVRFRKEGWRIKRLVREIVTSSTWRMGSIQTAIAAERDPLNRLLHRAPIRRLEGEAIRDKILAISGQLDPGVGGPSVPVHLTEFHAGRGRPPSGPLDGAGRRSLYTAVRRNFLPAVHHPARATSVIFLYMDGGVSQVDSFDPKPRLRQDAGKDPRSLFKVDATQFNNVGAVLPSPWTFQPRGTSGIPVSDLFPHIGSLVDELAVIRSMTSEFPEHTSANYFLHSGSGLQGRPSMGAWTGYGLGSLNDDLPGYVVINGGLIPPGGRDVRLTDVAGVVIRDALADPG